MATPEESKPHDLCVCGDYRSQHDELGRCRVCGNGMVPWNSCSKFKLFRHANDAEVMHWKKYHEVRA